MDVGVDEFNHYLMNLVRDFGWLPFAVDLARVFSEGLQLLQLLGSRIQAAESAAVRPIPY